MKKLVLATTALFSGMIALGQVTSDPPDFTPDQEIKIIVDLNATSNDWGIVEIATSGEDMYIWTWSPAEHPEGHPLVNGIGSQAWKNSNEALKMTKESEGVYSYTMIPTEFYEVDASTVYDQDIHFLVKPKDGGGYGDPDRKTEDLMLAVDPAITVKDPGFAFPLAPASDDVIAIIYEYSREDTTGGRMTKRDASTCASSLLGPDEVWMYAEVTTTDSTTHNISTFFTTPNNPDLLMDYQGDGVCTRYIVHEEFFAGVLPAGAVIDRVRFVPMTNYFLTNPDVSSGVAENRTEKDIMIQLACL